jgi:hypothetical protein
MFIKIDPAELCITILSLGFVHVSNKHTLRIMFDSHDPLLLTSKDD